MKLLFLALPIFYFIIIPRPLKSQNTFPFKCKIVHNKRGLLKNYSVIVNGQKATTNDAGIFLIALNNNLMYVKIELENTQYSVLYPSAGHLSLPKDQNEILEIIIGSPDDNRLLKEFISLNQKKNTLNDIELKNFVSQKLDSLTKTLLQLNYTQNDLERVKLLQEGKDRYFSEISLNLNEFVDKAANLNLVLKHTSEFAYNNSLVLSDINNAVIQYSNIYAKLSPQRTNYEKVISNYWQDDSLSNDFHNLITYLFENLHEKKILGLMDVIDQINRYREKIKNQQKIPKGEEEKIKQNIKNKLNSLQPTIEESLSRNKKFQKAFLN